MTRARAWTDAARGKVESVKKGLNVVQAKLSIIDGPLSLASAAMKCCT